MNDKKPSRFTIVAAIVALVVMVIAATIGMIFVANNPDMFKPDIKPHAIKGYNVIQRR